jgi:membrane protease YdiL (CAAX protease family)
VSPPIGQSRADRLNGDASLWRLVLLVACFSAIWSLAVALVWRPGWHAGQPDGWFGSAVKAVIWLGFAWTGARLAGTRQPLTWMGFRCFTSATIAVALAVAGAMLAKDLVRVMWLEGRSPNWHAFVGNIGPASLTGLIEETVFSGMILTWLSLHIGSAKGILVSSSLFLLIHVPGWAILNISVSYQRLAVVTLVALVCGTLRRSTGSLWPAIAAHAANNVGSAL